jgi:cyclic dehypoxanthinyl futalosine synthase
MTDSLQDTHPLLAEMMGGGPRLTVPEAVTLHRDADLLDLGRAAREKSFHIHGNGPVTFLIDRNINYTNVCRNRCRFCAFYREADSVEAFLLTPGGNRPSCR